MNDLSGILTVVLLFPFSLLALYQWVLGVISLFFRPPKIHPIEEKRSRFLVLIPAHNEEFGIESTLEGFKRLDYPPDSFRVVVIADRCVDATAAVARKHGVACFERSEGISGKGAAIAWGIQEARRVQLPFDAVVIVDADTVVDRELLPAFHWGLRAGHQVQQGYNYISNPWATPFTRIIAVTGALRNGRYYTGKTVLGLSGMLTGTGMCIGATALERYGWTAFSVGEDWEFSVELLLGGEHIYFNPLAKTYAKESQDLKQASRQRLRWASGRYAVMGNKVWALLRHGIRTGSVSLVDSAVTLVAPNYSSQASLSILCLALSWMNVGDPVWGFTATWALALFMAIAGYFMLGVFSTESPIRALSGLLLVPLFLPWRLTIELLGMLGYGRQHWGRMSRGTTSSQQVNR
ncbi:MAG: glycosyltransferase family 2 protein [Nitrospiraceae bacterium]